MDTNKKNRLLSLKRKIEAIEYILIFLFAGMLAMLTILPSRLISDEWMKTLSIAIVIDTAMIMAMAFTRYVIIKTFKI